MVWVEWGPGSGWPGDTSPVDRPVIPGFGGVNGCTKRIWFLHIHATCFLLAVRNVCCIMWSDVISFKFRLKDISSLVSLERDKSSVSRTFKEQKHIFYSIFSAVPLGMVSRGEVAVWQPCSWAEWYQFPGWEARAGAALSPPQPPPPRMKEGSFTPKHTRWITTSRSCSS